MTKSSPQKLYPRRLNFFWNFSKDLFVKLRRLGYNFWGELFLLNFLQTSFRIYRGKLLRNLNHNLVRIFSVIFQGKFAVANGVGNVQVKKKLSKDFYPFETSSPVFFISPYILRSYQLDCSHFFFQNRVEGRMIEKGTHFFILKRTSTLCFFNN